jgi:hypothetical protein
VQVGTNLKEIVGAGGGVAVNCIVLSQDRNQ